MNKAEKVCINLNGVSQDVLNLVPSLEGELAIVNLSVIQRLAELLSTSDLWEIKKRFKSRVSDVCKMADFVALLEEEIAFHKSVNLITTIGKEDIDDGLPFDEDGKPRVVGKITLGDIRDRLEKKAEERAIAEGFDARDLSDHY